MRTRFEVESRLQGLLCEELDRRLHSISLRLPHNCTHNHRQPLDHRPFVDGEANPSFNRVTQGRKLPVAQTLGLCMLGSEDVEHWPGSICEDPIDAQRCPYFNPRHTRQQAYEDLLSDLQKGDLPGEIQALAWVVGQPPKLPWWKKLWAMIRRTSYEPLAPSEDVLALLPPADPR